MTSSNLYYHGNQVTQRARLFESCYSRESARIIIMEGEGESNVSSIGSLQLLSTIGFEGMYHKLYFFIFLLNGW